MIRGRALKSAIFFDAYKPFHVTKDPGLIALGLNRLGCSTILITQSKEELRGYSPPFRVVTVEKEKFTEAAFWRGIDVEVVICYTWLVQDYNTILAAIRESGKKIAVKADSNGRLGYPVASRYRAPRLKASWVGKALYSVFRVKGKKEQIELADVVLIESPKALDNACKFLTYWGRPDLTSKFCFVPNPVTDEISNSVIPTKQNTVISVGRWDDRAQKNTPIMLKCCKSFLAGHPDWRCRIVATLGHGKDSVEKSVSKWNSALKERLEVLGPLDHHNEMTRLLGESRILFMPSNWESFGISAAEAVCMGCTVVGTPLEPLDFLVAGGLSGTLAKDFAFESLMQALAFDASKHKQGTYDPIEIAAYWRPRLSIREVASRIYELVSDL